MARYGTPTETVTYKCEGCGVRKPDGTQYDLFPRLTQVMAAQGKALRHMACSPCCWKRAEQAQSKRHAQKAR